MLHYHQKKEQATLAEGLGYADLYSQEWLHIKYLSIYTFSPSKINYSNQCRTLLHVPKFLPKVLFLESISKKIALLFFFLIFRLRVESSA